MGRIRGGSGRTSLPAFRICTIPAWESIRNEGCYHRISRIQNRADEGLLTLPRLMDTGSFFSYLTQENLVIPNSTANILSRIQGLYRTFHSFSAWHLRWPRLGRTFPYQQMGLGRKRLSVVSRFQPAIVFHGIGT